MKERKFTNGDKRTGSLEPRPQDKPCLGPRPKAYPQLRTPWAHALKVDVWVDEVLTKSSRGMKGQTII